MIFKNTCEKFGLVSKSFHWIVGILILYLLTVGFQMVTIPVGPAKLWVYALHKSFGILILTLVIGRLVWRLSTPRPDALPAHKEWENKLSKIVHFILYVCMFLMPLSGWAMSSAGGFPATFFGLFSLPAILPKSPALFSITRTIHEFTAYGLLGCLALHFAGAFKHHFIDRDATLQRMTSPKVGLKLGLVLAAIAGLLWVTPVGLALFAQKGGEAVATQGAQTAAQDASPLIGEGWAIDLSNSVIEFEATQYGETFKGAFKNFGGTIIFDRAKLDDAYADIWVDIGSIDSGSADRDGQAKSGEWFDTEHFPRALFVADSFSETGPNQYVAHGALTIRGKGALVDLPFSLQIRESPQGQAALMEGEITLNRLDFGIGQRQWASTETIGDAVKIRINVLALAE